MKLVKAAIVIVIMLGVGALLAWQFLIKDQIDLARVATPYGAKMVCSCRFVAERPMESCLADFTEDVSAVSFHEEDNAIRATVLGGVGSATAVHEEGLGCSLIEQAQ